MPALSLHFQELRYSVAPRPFACGSCGSLQPQRQESKNVCERLRPNWTSLSPADNCRKAACPSHCLLNMACHQRTCSKEHRCFCPFSTPKILERRRRRLNGSYNCELSRRGVDSLACGGLGLRSFRCAYLLCGAMGGGVLDPSQPSLKLEVQGIKPLNFAASLTAISGFIEVRVVCERITTVSGLIPPCVVGGVAILLDCR